MKKKIIIIIIAIILIAGIGFFWSSKHKNRFNVDVSNINVNIKIERFDKDIYNTDTTKIEDEILRFRQQYGKFFDIYSQGVMQFGDPDNEEFAQTFKAFLRDSVFHGVYKKSIETYDDVSDIEEKLTDAFRRGKHFFPDKQIPRILMHVSGFNQSVVVTDSALSVSIDNYLGEDYELYQELLYKYQLIETKPQKVPSEYIKGWLLTEFPMPQYSERLLDNMIHRGKIMFALENMMPEEDEETLISYTPEQLEWCYDNQHQMWTYMMEEKQLFKSERMLSAKYIDEAPTTSYFPSESPGRTGIWIGWQIVRSYMKNNENVSMYDLMKDTDYQKILEKSGYRP